MNKCKTKQERIVIEIDIQSTEIEEQPMNKTWITSSNHQKFNYNSINECKTQHLFALAALNESETEFYFKTNKVYIQI